MRIATFVSSLLIVGIGTMALAGEIQTATGAVTLESATDKVESIQTATGEVPGRDVGKLAVASDGTEIRLTATMTEPPSGTGAASVVRMFVDVDDDAATGETATFSDVSGFEFQIDLNLCVKYDTGVVACAGTVGTKAVGYSAVAVVRNTATGAEVKDIFDIPETPVAGNDVAAPVPYADLGVRSGQTVRIYAREGDGPMDASSYFPQVKLTLK